MSEKGNSDTNLPECLQDLRKGIFSHQGSPHLPWMPQADYTQDFSYCCSPCQLCSSTKQCLPSVRGAQGRPPLPPWAAAWGMSQDIYKHNLPENSHRCLGSIVGRVKTEKKGWNLATSITLCVNALVIAQQGRDGVSTQPTLLLLQDNTQPWLFFFFSFFFPDLVGENQALKFLLGRHNINHPASCLSSPHCWDFERDSSSINESSRLLAESYKTAACNSKLWKEHIFLSQCMLKVLSEIIKGQKERIWPKL